MPTLQPGHPPSGCNCQLPGIDRTSFKVFVAIKPTLFPNKSKDTYCSHTRNSMIRCILTSNRPMVRENMISYPLFSYASFNHAQAYLLSESSEKYLVVSPVRGNF